MGGGKESTPTILARAGVENCVLRFDIRIPAGREPVTLDLASVEGYIANPLTVGNQDLNPVTIAGITGDLGLVNKWGKTTYTFTRREAGEEVECPKGTEVFFSNVDEYRNYLHVIWLGAFDHSYETSLYLKWCKALLARQISNTDRFIIIGPCSYGGSWSASHAIMALDEVDASMTALYGDHYISLRSYLVNDGLTDADLTATVMDKASIARGSVPESLRTGSGTVELSSKAYELVGQLVYDRMNRLGYFQEIRDELNIVE